MSFYTSSQKLCSWEVSFILATDIVDNSTVVMVSNEEVEFYMANTEERSDACSETS